MTVHIHTGPNELADATARFIAGLVAAASDEFTIGFAGGSTPETTYRVLRSLDVDWDRVVGWLSDERWVPPDHPESNGMMVARTLLDHVSAPLFRPEWSEDPVAAARIYDATIRGLHAADPPDLVLLGMGSDGHVASLFPGTGALSEREHWIVANRVPQLETFRITVTYPLLEAAGQVVVIVAGDSKSEALAAVAAGSSDMPAAPIWTAPNADWFMDTAAASLLP